MKKYSRIVSLILVLGMLLCFTPLQAVAAQKSYTDRYGVWEYNINADGTLTLIKYDGDAKHVVIPLIIDGKRVSALGNNLFHKNTTMATVVIPEGIQSIGNSTFSQCSKLETVQIPSTVTSIGNNAFASCEKLGRILIPSTVQTIGNNAFKDCPNVNIVCEAGSAAEAYIKSGKDDIKAYTVVERTPVVNTNTPADTSSDPKVNTKDSRLTYQFGKKVNGKYEYTLVIEDKKLGFDLEAYMRQNPNSMDVMKLMDTRFQIISLTLADGTVYTPEKPLFMTTNNIHSERLANGTEVYMFRMFTNLPRQIGELVLEKVNFVSKVNKDELIDYTETVFNTATNGITASASQVLDVNGKLLEEGSFKYEYKEYLTAPPLKFANVWVSENENVNTKLTESGLGVNVRAEEGEALAFTYRYTNEGKPVGFRSRQEVFDENGIRTQIADSGVYYSVEGEVSTSRLTSVTKVEDNTYNYESTSHHPEVDVHNYTHPTENGTITGTDLQSDTFSYRDVTLKAKNAVAAYDRAGSALSNEVHEKNLKDIASEHKDLISDRYVFGNTHHEESTTSKGDVISESTRDYDWRDLRDHYYVGDTGHYVGWDWQQSADYQDEKATTPSYYNYTVTEYRSDGKTWTKTVVELSGPSKDCLTGDTSSLSAQNARVSVYQYDPGHDSPADDWAPITIKENDGTNINYDLGADKEVTCNVSDILQGASSVIANGETYYQKTEKAEMVNIMNEVSNTDEVLEKDFAQNVIDTVLSGPESKDLLDAVGVTPVNPSSPFATGLTSDEESAAEESVAEAPAADETTVEAPAADETAAEAPAADETAAEAPATDETAAEAPAADETAAEAPAAVEAVTNAPAAVEAVTNAPAAVEAVTNAPAAVEAAPVEVIAE